MLQSSYPDKEDKFEYKTYSVNNIEIKLESEDKNKIQVDNDDDDNEELRNANQVELPTMEFNSDWGKKQAV